MIVKSIATADLTSFKADALVVAVRSRDGEAGLELTPSAQVIDEASGGLISQLIKSGDVASGDLALTRVLAPRGLAVDSLVVACLGKPTQPQEGLAFRVAGAAAKMLAAKKRCRIVMALDLDATDEVVAGAVVGSVGQDLLRKQRKLFGFDELHVPSLDAVRLRRGEILGEAINLTRRLVNLPPNDVFPESFAEECLRQGKNHRFDVEVWDRERLTKERCGALLAVARGSTREPRMVIMRHTQGGPDRPTIALVGKGVTFDSGGLSIKPTEGMTDMKCDMAGAATVLGTMSALSQLKLDVNVIGLVGLVENMISGDCFRLGDVLVARNGKTIEVLNTDAEGRLVLADVLDVAVGLQADRIVDLATLTGACMVALGRFVVGGMTNNHDWYQDVSAAAGQCGERLWQLPMFPEYSEQIRSSIADLKNVGDGRWGGAITAAKFLEEFVAEKPWVHLDIAGPAYLDNGPAWVDSGASGCFVRTLIQLLENQQ